MSQNFARFVPDSLPEESGIRAAGPTLESAQPRHRPDVAERQQRGPAPSPNRAVATLTLFDQSSRRNDNAHNSTTRKKHRRCVSRVNMKPAFSRNSDEAGRLDAGLTNRGKFEDRDRDLFPARTNPDFVNADSCCTRATGLVSATQKSTPPLKTGPLLFRGPNRLHDS